MKNIQSTEFLTEAQKRNPVYLAMLEVFDTTWGMITDIEKIALTFLAESKAPNYNSQGKFFDGRGPHGESIFEQTIGIALDMEDAARTNGGSACITKDSDFMSAYNEHAVEVLMDLVSSMGEPVKDPMLFYAYHMVPVPFEECRYSRLSNKAVEYLVSLGKPSASLVLAYMEEMGLLAASNPHGVYEEIIYLTLNGKPTAIYLTVRKGYILAIRYTKNNVCPEIYHKRLVDPAESDQDDELVFDTSFDESKVDCTLFDLQAFIVNLWAAKMANSFEETSEPQETRQAVGAITGPVKPDFNSYRYVRITPQGEREFEESRSMLAQARCDVGYRKSIWFCPAYYARRGADKRIVLNKASIHHRRCAEVTAPQKPTMYT